jgi:uridine kinase
MSYIIGIAGASGSGKSSLAEALARCLAVDHQASARYTVGALSLDWYYRDLSHLDAAARAAVNFDSAAAMDWERIRSDLRQLKAGHATAVPDYDFVTHCRLGAGRLLPPPTFLVVEGLFTLVDSAVRQCLDFSVFVAAPAEVCLARRLQRDQRERGRSEESVRKQFERDVRPSMEQVITPSGRYATLVVSGEAPLAASVAAVMRALPPAMS